MIAIEVQDTQVLSYLKRLRAQLHDLTPALNPAMAGNGPHDRPPMNRARLIALVHAGPRALGWDETTRRAWMEKTVGKRSAKDCGEAELIHLVEALRVAGFRPAPPVKRPGGPGLNNSAAESAREFLYERDQDRAGQYRDGRAAQQTVKKGCKHGIR